MPLASLGLGVGGRVKALPRLQMVSVGWCQSPLGWAVFLLALPGHCRSG